MNLHAGAQSGWFNGDFNYDGLINGDDYAVIDNAFNTQGSISLAAAPASGNRTAFTTTSLAASFSSETNSLPPRR